jgi:hypothetical protein
MKNNEKYFYAICKKNPIGICFNYEKEKSYRCMHTFSITMSPAIKVFNLTPGGLDDYFYVEDFYKYFYTVQELRKLKLNKLNERSNMQ